MRKQILLAALLSLFSVATTQAQVLETKQYDRENIGLKQENVEDFVVVEECPERMPHFPGDKGDGVVMMAWFRTHMRFPKVKPAVDETVYVTFVVKADGSITDAKVAKSQGIEEYDKEALRLINAMPNWVPGRQYGVSGKPDGEPVDTKFTLPVRFRESDLIDKIAHFPGDNGDGKVLNQFIIKNNRIKRKGNAKRSRVMVQFTVLNDGGITNAHVVYSSGIEAYDNEALRLVNAMPNWVPAVSVNGAPALMEITLPFVF